MYPSGSAQSPGKLLTQIFATSRAVTSYHIFRFLGQFHPKNRRNYFFYYTYYKLNIIFRLKGCSSHDPCEVLTFCAPIRSREFCNLCSRGTLLRDLCIEIYFNQYSKRDREGCRKFNCTRHRWWHYDLKTLVGTWIQNKTLILIEKESAEVCY